MVKGCRRHQGLRGNEDSLMLLWIRRHRRVAWSFAWGEQVGSSKAPVAAAVKRRTRNSHEVHKSSGTRHATLCQCVLAAGEPPAVACLGASSAGGAGHGPHGMQADGAGVKLYVPPMVYIPCMVHGVPTAGVW